MIDQATKNLLATLRKQASLAKYAPYMADEPDEIKTRLDDVARRIERWRAEAKEQIVKLVSFAPGVVTSWAFDNIDTVCDDLLREARREETEQDDSR